MSKRTKKVGSSGRFSSRYGVKSRTMIREVESQQKKRHACPRCGKNAVQRTSTSIWECSKCGNIFAGGAYLPSTPAGATAEKVLKGMPVEVPVEEESKWHDINVDFVRKQYNSMWRTSGCNARTAEARYFTKNDRRLLSVLKADDKPGTISLCFSFYKGCFAGCTILVAWGKTKNTKVAGLVLCW